MLDSHDVKRIALTLSLLAAPACIGPRGEVCWIPSQSAHQVEVQPRDVPLTQDDQEPVAQTTAPAPTPPWLEIGLAFSDDAAWFTSRTRLAYSGFVDTGFLFDDDAFALHVGAMRVGQPGDDSRLSLGVGIGLYGVFIDDPDENLSALTLSGLAAYRLDTGFPTRLVAQVSFSPDATTFGDAEGLIDATAGAEIAIGSFASAAFGYRLFEVDLDDDADVELTNGLYLGVSLSF